MRNLTAHAPLGALVLTSVTPSVALAQTAAPPLEPLVAPVVLPMTDARLRATHLSIMFDDHLDEVRRVRRNDIVGGVVLTVVGAATWGAWFALRPEVSPEVNTAVSFVPGLLSVFGVVSLASGLASRSAPSDLVALRDASRRAVAAADPGAEVAALEARARAHYADRGVSAWTWVNLGVGLAAGGVGMYGALASDSPTVRDLGGFGVGLGVALLASSITSLLATRPAADLRWRTYALSHGLSP